MRIFIIISISLLIGCSLKNEITNETHIDDELLPYVEEFKADCEKYGWDYNHIYNLNSIRLSDDISSKYGAQGITFFNEREILINSQLLYNETGLRVVVYHELGHWFGLDHEEYGIMLSSYDGCKCVNEEYNKNWEHYVEYMMTQQEVSNCGCDHTY